MEFITTMNAAAESTASNSAAAAQNPFVSMIATFLPLVLMFGVMYFLLIRPQKKREKQMQDMRNALKVGDEVVTSGGIIGLVVSIKDDTVLIETGNDRSKIRVQRWAIQNNLTPIEEQSK